MNQNSVLEGDSEDVFIQKFNEWFLGDQYAVDFCLKFVKVLHIWDDLVDKDREVCEEEVNEIFRYALYDIPTNPFYRIHLDKLSPLVLNIIHQWLASNVFERNGDDDLINKAYVLRAGFYNIFIQVAFCVGGHEWANIVSVDVWNTYAEKLEEYRMETKTTDFNKIVGY